MKFRKIKGVQVNQINKSYWIYETGHMKLTEDMDTGNVYLEHGLKTKMNTTIRSRYIIKIQVN